MPSCTAPWLACWIRGVQGSLEPVLTFEKRLKRPFLGRKMKGDRTNGSLRPVDRWSTEEKESTSLMTTIAGTSVIPTTVRGVSNVQRPKI